MARRRSRRYGRRGRRRFSRFLKLRRGGFRQP